MYSRGYLFGSGNVGEQFPLLSFSATLVLASCRQPPTHRSRKSPACSLTRNKGSARPQSLLRPSFSPIFFRFNSLPTHPSPAGESLPQLIFNPNHSLSPHSVYLWLELRSQSTGSEISFALSSLNQDEENSENRIATPHNSNHTRPHVLHHVQISCLTYPPVPSPRNSSS